MAIKISEGAQAPSTNTVVEKTVVIDTPNKTLDALAGKTAVAATPAIKSEVETEEETSAATTETTTEVEVLDETASTTEEAEQEDEIGEDQEDNVDLDEVSIEFGGQERVVSELLADLDKYSKRVAEIDKDPFLKGFIDHYLATGNANAYLENKGVDWDKRDDLSVIRARFEKENAGLSEKGREIMWRRRLADTYKIKPDLTQEEMDSEDYQLGQEILKRDADVARGEFKDTQKKFQVVDRKQEEQQTQKFDPQAYKKQILAEKEVEAFMKNKLLKLGIKNDSGVSFGFEPENPDQIIEMMVDDRKFLGTFFDFNTKKVDRIKQAKIYAFAQNPDAYDQQLVEFGKNQLLEQRLKEDKNTDGRLNRKTTEATTKETSKAKGHLAAMSKAVNKYI